MNLPLFVLAAIVARGARFCALAFLLARYGEEISTFVARRLGPVQVGPVAAPTAIYLGVKMAVGDKSGPATPN